MSKPTRQAPEAWEIEALPPPSRTEWQPPADILARFITPVCTPGHGSLAELRAIFDTLDDEVEENRALVEMLNDNNIIACVQHLPVLHCAVRQCDPHKIRIPYGLCFFHEH